MPCLDTSVSIRITPKLSLREKIMINPVAVKYMSKDEIERLMYSFTADKSNEEAQTFEALVRRLLEIFEEQNR
jgi:hypothetical protein